MSFRLLRFVLIVASMSTALAGCECGDPDLPDGSVPDGGVDGSTNPDGGPTPPTVTICPGDSLPPLTDGICEATAGDANMLITADVLTPGEVFRGGQVLIDASGSITCVGCDCEGEAGAAGAKRLVCPDGVLSPGLINAHEHVTFQAYPYTGTAERYEHRNDWRRGERDHTGVSNGASVDTQTWDELRMVMAGVTSVNGSGSSGGLARNLDVASAQEGLGQPAADYDTFPLGDNDGEQLATGCAYPRLPSATRVATEDAYTPHVAEGIDAESRNEFLCMRDGATDIVEPNVAFIHGVGLLAPDIAEMASSQTTLVWSPRSNIVLYGDTARVTLYDNLGVLIAMGTDWQRSGSMNMLRELRCADEFNQDYLGGHFSDEQLWLMATRNGAVATATDDAIGTIAPGLVADIAIYDGSMHGDHRAVLDAEPDDVALVLRAGRVLYGEVAVVSALESGCDTIDVCGSQRAACVMRELGMSYSALTSMNTSAYPLFVCGGATPDDEPTCVPSRNADAPLPSPSVDGSSRYDGMITSSDMDGDSIENGSDNCPAIFNPIRPLDMGAQADFDMDGVGDECDPCPLDADTTTCAGVDPNDRDRDGVVDTADNCPNVPNMDQLDSDMDGSGDLCDACPMHANPAGSSCPATIYDVKTGTFTAGASVAISESVVTGVGVNGFTMQVPTDHPDYDTADFSGIFVYTGGVPALSDATPITRGMTVDTDGAIGEFFGQLQLMSPTITESATARTMPEPVLATPAEVDTTGTRAEELESVLVTLASVTVTDVMPAPTRTGASAANEFEIDASLRVDDYFFVLDPFVLDGENFASITGVMMLRDERHKLMPRDADDYLAGAAQLAGITPALSYARAGAGSIPTFPEPLTVRLTRATAVETVVTIVANVSSTDPELIVTDVTIPAGASSAPVPAMGVTAGTYTVTATLGTDVAMADVRVLGATEAPTTITLSPVSPVTVAVDGTVTFTVTIDIPAPPGGADIVNIVDTTGGTVVSTVTVPADAVATTFDYLAPSTEASGSLTAELSGTLAVDMVTIEVVMTPGTVVINEVDYDQVGTDGGEYIELVNPGATPIDLAGLQLILVNGESTPPGASYRTIDLSAAGASLAAGQYLVIRAAGVTVPGGALTIDFAAATNNIQNGEPDGIAVWDTTSMTLLDALSYEGIIATAAIGGMTLTLAEGAATTVIDLNDAIGSLCRIPDGSDTNDSATDWVFSSCLTPGGENVTTCD